MKKSFQRFALICLSATIVLGAANKSQAGLVPWAYNVIFGPVGSLRANPGTFRAHRPLFRPFRANYGYGGYNSCYGGYNYQPSCGTGCNTGYNYGSYQAGYYPTQSYYGGYNNYGCNSCYSGCNGCSSCLQGCGSGNCHSVTTPATGVTTPPATTPTPATPTPTTTFKSTDPTVKPDAFKEPTKTKETPYDESESKGEGFKMPSRTEDSGEKDAPPFNPFGATPTEALKVPAAAPLLPVERKQPAPSDFEESESSVVPSLKLIPAPIEIDETEVTHVSTPTRSRIIRIAHFAMPEVARLVPQPNSGNPFVPPSPSPVHIAGK